MKSYYSIRAQKMVTLKVAGLFCQAKYLMVSSNNNYYRTKNRMIEQSNLTFIHLSTIQE